MAGWIVLIVVIAFLITITYDDFDPPDDGDGVHSDAMCCGGGCHV
jgi:hypothetical protein